VTSFYAPDLWVIRAEDGYENQPPEMEMGGLRLDEKDKRTFWKISIQQESE
jgi:hypothetical protein